MRDIYQESAACPLYTAIAVIAGRWKPMILQRVAPRPIGFGALRRTLPGITTKVLREQLRQLMADDLVTREPRDAAARGVLRYRVTDHGRSLGPVIESLWDWGRQHLARPGATGGTRAAPPGRSPARRQPGT